MSRFKKGADAAKEASKGVQFARTQYFSLKDGEEAYLRFLTDAEDWITVNQHNFVPTKGKPANYEGDNWPSMMGAVCRKTKLEDGSTLFDDCFICEHMRKKDGKPYPASARTWALAVLREEVRDEDGTIIGYRDQTREIAQTDKDGKPTGETKVEKAVVIVNQGYRNFFSTLQGFAGRYGTVLDRDYYIKRDGDDKDTTYAIVPMDPLPAKDPDDPDNEIVFDLRDERLMARYEDSAPDLDELIESRADEEFYERFFAPSKGGDGSDAASSDPEPEVDAERMKALADRVKGYGSKVGKAEANGDDTEAEPAKAKAGATPQALD